MTGEVKAVRLAIAGRVQGVGFREWLRRQAEAAGIAGWARNRRDGSFEALLAGDAAAVDALVERCRTGPRSAAVRSVAVEPASADGVGPGFVVRATE